MKFFFILMMFAASMGSFAQQPNVRNELKIGGDKDVYMLTYFRQRYPTRIEIDAKGNIIEVPLPDPMQVEKLHIALSTDGRHWTALNDNEPVWSRQMRDPFVRRGPDGLWRLLATGGGRELDRAKVGPGCLYATSKDLINWQVEGALPLMKEARNDEGALARNIWAPEWFYDEKTEEYMLFWSSSFKDAGWKESRLWYCKTRDWKTFTPAQVLFEPSYSVIDGTLLEHDGAYYLFHKEEEFGEKNGERRAIRVATSKNLEGPYHIIEGPLNQGQIVPVITEGPSVAKDLASSGWLLFYDYCMTNRFGVSYSPDLINWSVTDNVDFPSEARHGTVSIIKSEEAKKLIEAYPVSGTKTFTRYVNPFYGTTTLWDSIDLGYKPSPNPEFRTVLTEQGRRPAQGYTRAWGAETFPGATLPHGMVQATPVTMWGSGSGYQYEDPNIYAFFHSSKGQWGLGHVPVLPFTGEITADNYHSGYSHENESAKAGYYQVFLERYGINAEMTTTLRCAYHKYTFRDGDAKKLLLNLSRMNSLRAESRWTFNQVNENTFSGSQSDIYFYAVTNHKINSTDSVKNSKETLSIVNFADSNNPLEVKIGFSFVSIEKAKKNLEAEMMNKSFAQTVDEADETWENLLSKIQVEGGTEKQKQTFYSCLYRALQYPALRSDADGEYTESRGNVVNKGFDYYTSNNYWDTWSCKMVLMGMMEPEVTNNVIRSDIERAKASGYLSSGFHGDFSTAFITGMYLRGIRDFDVESAYRFELNNATVPPQTNRRGGRRYLEEYMQKGWIAENRVSNPTVKTEEDEAKAAVSKTIEFAYSDYAVALLAKEMGDMDNYNLLMQRSRNYKNLFDPSTGFIRGRWDNGDWITPYDPGYPYYVYMFRETSGWQATFFAPQDPHGLIGLFPSKQAFEQKLDSLFTTPFAGYEADNLTGWFGQYCAGNQPAQGISYYYYFIDKQEKAQEKLDILMNKYYGMGKEGLAYAGMDDEGGLSAWYVLNAIGLYSFSPADPEYIITVPIFDHVDFKLGDTPFSITKRNKGRKITDITYDGQKIDGYFISHDDLKEGKELVITTEQ
ncbi:MAG: GH92 family glycosyl hydrolase [Tannerellaceae bacterium]|jgi:predicted alpha-1,2-mannosidase|nr:GH92 family glycosyl hydrolase [Tannerellaceae bacterium]